MKKKVIIASTIMLALTSCSVNGVGGNNEIQTVTESVSKPYVSKFNLLPVNLPAYSPAIAVVAENVAQDEAKVLEDEFQGYNKLPLDKDLQEYIKGLCDKYNLSFEMVLSVINLESGFDPKSVSDNGQDFGLMQLNKPSNTLSWLAKEVENDDSFTITSFKWNNAYHNATAGIWYLSWIRDRLIEKGYTSQEQLFPRVLLCYNRGMGNGIAYIKSGKNPNNDKYVKTVKEFKNKLETGEYK